jgi:hypothetical protein
MKHIIMDMAVEDLELKKTRDGYSISLKRADEMEALRLMQTIDTSKKGAGARCNWWGGNQTGMVGRITCASN